MILILIGLWASIGVTCSYSSHPFLCALNTCMYTCTYMYISIHVCMYVTIYLSSICRYVVQPYHTYPNLLDTLFSFLKTEQMPGMRREVIRVLGLLGALDPYKHKQHRRSGQRSLMGTPISKPMDKTSQVTRDRCVDVEREGGGGRVGGGRWEGVSVESTLVE